MSVLTEFAMFPTDKGSSVSEYVSKIINLIKKSKYSYQLTAMGTILETNTLPEALALIQDSYDLIEPYSDRIYSTITFDIRKNKDNRMQGKIESIENKIGKVNK